MATSLFWGMLYADHIIIAVVGASSEGFIFLLLLSSMQKRPVLQSFHTRYTILYFWALGIIATIKYITKLLTINIFIWL